jgi:hypothetical protein
LSAPVIEPTWYITKVSLEKRRKYPHEDTCDLVILRVEGCSDRPVK